MSSLGKSINLYLMDGSASERWQANLSNWNGVAYKIPRGKLKECNDLSDLKAPGVYFLFGKDDETGKSFIYVGEADNVEKRLLQPHSFENDGSYWTEVVTFVTPDGTLEKGQVKYLEHRFYTIAQKAKRYVVKNGNTPPKSPLSKPVQDSLEEFIINVELILPTLGYSAFVPLPSEVDKEGDEPLLYFSRNLGKSGKGIGRITSEGFWVLKGSFIYPKLASYISQGIKRARKAYAGIIDANGILQDDICFGSPSYAAMFICGKSSNGLIEWKNKQGISLKELDIAETTIPKVPSAIQPKISSSLSEKAKNDNIKNMLHLAGRKVKATAYISDNQFIVCKNSEFSTTETPSCPKYVHERRQELMAEGKVQDGYFIEDVPFSSSSTAAACVTGGSANGRKMWLYQDGQSIKEKGEHD